MKDLSLKHIIRPSSLKEKAPLLILLHGYGSDENDLFSFSTELPEELFIISIKAPYDLQPFGHAWYAINFDAEKGKWSDNDQAIKSRDKISYFIDEAIEAYEVDKDNVNLLGFSQGTILSYAVALSYPEKIKNVVALSGYLNMDIIKTNFKSNNLSHLSFYCSHGSVDQVIPVDWARRSQEVLTVLNIEHVYEEFPVGHGVSPNNFYALREWLKTKL